VCLELLLVVYLQFCHRSIMCSTAKCLVALLPVLCAPPLVASLSIVSQEFEAAETEDQNFLAMQWRDLESDMLKLQKNFAMEEAHSSGFLQLRATPVAKAAEVKVEPKGKPEVATVNAEPSSKKPKVQQSGKLEPGNTKKHEGKSAAKVGTSDTSKPVPMADRLAQAEAMTKGLVGKAMLAPMEGMLEGMYDDQKKRIGELNKREQKSKERFAKQQAEFDQRIKDIQTRHNNHKLSDEFFKNETRDYTRQFKYWQGVRERNHRQFHNALKITHGMMQREKDMISQYKAAMSMKMPEDKKKATAAAPVEAPEVVFVQKRKAAAAFIQEALIEVRRNLAETLSTEHDSRSSK